MTARTSSRGAKYQIDRITIFDMIHAHEAYTGNIVHEHMPETEHVEALPSVHHLAMRQLTRHMMSMRTMRAPWPTLRHLSVRIYALMRPSRGAGMRVRNEERRATRREHRTRRRVARSFSHALFFLSSMMDSLTLSISVLAGSPPE